MELVFVCANGCAADLRGEMSCIHTRRLWRKSYKVVGHIWEMEQEGYRVNQKDWANLVRCTGRVEKMC